MPHPTKNKSLKQKLIWHLKVALGAGIFAIVFSYILKGKVIHAGLPNMLILIFLELEIFIWLGTWFFQSIKSDDPKFSKKMVTRLLLFYITVLLIAFIFFLGLFTYYFIKDGSDFSLFFESFFKLNVELKSFFSATMIGFALGALSFFYTQWQEALNRFQKLKEEKLIFQYETLKNQVNPHFLFNSLNTLSSMVSQDAELSEIFIQKLSSVYRYILENQEKELVKLDAELKFVQDYFYLQKIRDEEKIQLTIELNPNDEVFILPVSLQMLVENAIKHNAATRKEPLDITIHFEGMDKLVVRNRLQKKTQLKDSSKIGLKNLNERCRLILNREIEIQETAEEFVVKVPVKLA